MPRDNPMTFLYSSLTSILPEPVIGLIQEYYVAPKEIAEFLKLVTEGEQDKAETMLKINSDLALVPGDVTDLSKRTFTNITAFQYAVWALDWHMWTMIRKYLPDDEAKKQAEGFETGSWVRQHGVQAQHLLDNLVKALQTTIDLYQKAEDATFFKDKKFSEANTSWVQQVGGAQLLLPAHVINEYCHPTRSFDPCPNFKDSAALPRTRKVNEGEWFTASYNSGTLGVKFACARAWALGGSWLWVEYYARSVCDRNSIRVLSSTRIAQREELITELRAKPVRKKAA